MIITIIAITIIKYGRMNRTLENAYLKKILTCIHECKLVHVLIFIDDFNVTIPSQDTE